MRILPAPKSTNVQEMKIGLILSFGRDAWIFDVAPAALVARTMMGTTGNGNTVFHDVAANAI